MTWPKVGRYTLSGKSMLTFVEEHDLKHEGFYTWKLSTLVTRQLRPLVTKHSWMTESCITWYDDGQPGYWQKMTHCPYCFKVIPREIRMACCGKFNNLISPKDVIKPPSFSPFHKKQSVQEGHLGALGELLPKMGRRILDRGGCMLPLRTAFILTREALLSCVDNASMSIKRR